MIAGGAAVITLMATCWLQPMSPYMPDSRTPLPYSPPLRRSAVLCSRAARDLTPAYSRRRPPLDIFMMPEGPECKRMADELSRFEGNLITKMEILSGRYMENGLPTNFEEFKDKMIPAKIERVGNKGKFIYFLFEWEHLVDLGNVGSVEHDRDGVCDSLLARMLKLENEIHTRFMMEMIENEEDENTNLSVFYNDVRNFGTLTFSLDPAVTILNDAIHLRKSIWIAKRQKKSRFDLFVRFLAVFLMDQKKARDLIPITSGIGNYILSECLYKSNLDPWLLVGDLNEDQWMDLFHAIQETIYESYKSSGVSRRGADGVKRIGMYEGLDGEAGHYTDKLLVLCILDDFVAG
ncbi:hypothetical protein GUITHDRAFT_145137 [Guillardia theta CCMP2712]|uniref:Formamidopyrimidine-DNA glycosylase catalytic domain-containing protein n=1 Tax=Guillardia theta (strain CCMP2712) TaxID=905079 RepID=L1IML5_GUITC|nr:hypothetical protein GUITHDRAFT_145137 [Guillardia theta CCMP2712]EKX37322.1 hypothetical protein GUITHDRAFT_145137 [Guillardia theta CCMP2712]|eukprot:XP_005824302.1 hypothetical protein GUITHDRAFT_145137 [Guillardia theta CCMP2712]